MLSSVLRSFEKAYGGSYQTIKRKRNTLDCMYNCTYTLIRGCGVARAEGGGESSHSEGA